MDWKEARAILDHLERTGQGLFIEGIGTGRSTQ